MNRVIDNPSLSRQPSASARSDPPPRGDSPRPGVRHPGADIRPLDVGPLGAAVAGAPTVGLVGAGPGRTAVVALDPRQPTTVYFAANGGDFSQLYKSLDAGATWAPIGPSPGPTVQPFVDPQPLIRR